MKKVLTGSIIAVMVVFLSAGAALAGYGQGGNKRGAGDGTGPVHDIYSGTPFTYEGDVIEMVPGQGLLIATESGNVTVYGIGPFRYWDSVGVDRPAVGDTITVTGYEVDYNGEIRNIATTITIDPDVVDLRDPETGAPLWRGGRWR
ncbi:MAG: hypothetical protein K9L83_04245 [Deltaproteobacteria bacterium]|nr:hypothetical protein [Deltaproteobacteria bacterium]